jgi:hypothetical protein
MNFELSGGALYVQDINGEPELFAEDVCGVADLQESATEALPMYYNLKSSADLSCEMKYFDLDLLDKICDTAPTGHFILQYQRPIMIQARWHKKPRIRKKWLKRYGMKPDTLKIKTNATVVEYHTDDGNFEFETDKLEYIWRPDQKRRGLKIEW